MNYIKLLAVLIAFAMTGCGGGGGGSEISNNTIRQLQIGDQINYSFTYTYGSDGELFTTTSTFRQTVYSSPYNPLYGNRSLKLELVYNLLTINNKISTAAQDVYIEQDSAGNIYSLGPEERYPVNATAPPRDYNSPMFVGQTHTYTASYSDGITNTNNWSVDSIETVAGYKAYKVHCHSTASNGTTIDASYWFVPALGCNVKKIIVVQGNEDGQLWQIEYEFTMTSKNF